MLGRPFQRFLIVIALYYCYSMVKLNHVNKLVINAEYLERKLLNYVTSIVDGKSSPGHHY
jgi:hypothetical protein